MNNDVPPQKVSESRQVQNKEARAARCPACQLQLCKARDSRPHEKLVVVEKGSMLQGGDRAYTCQTCGVTLVNSHDSRKPGWSHARPN